MKFYNILIRYRLWFSLGTIAIAVLLNVTKTAGFWPTFPLYFLAVIGIVSEFLIGPLRLVQEPMEAGNFEEVQRILDSIKYPNLLIKPIRSSYLALKGNLAMMNKDFSSAEKLLKESSDLGSPMPQAESNNKLQLGMMAMQKSNFKEAEEYLRGAIRLGFAEKDSEAFAYLGMCQIMANKRQFKASKEFFRKAKALKPQQKEIVDQIKEIEKYISRMPG